MSFHKELAQLIQNIEQCQDFGSDITLKTIVKALKEVTTVDDVVAQQSFISHIVVDSVGDMNIGEQILVFLDNCKKASTGARLRRGPGR